MHILAAYDLTGSYRAAAKLAGCSHHTVARVVAERDAGGACPRERRPRTIDEFLPKIEEWVYDSENTIRADKAHEKLVAAGIKSRVVSMPSWELFEHQPQEYKDSVLPPSVTARVSVEQASTLGWERYTGLTGKKIGMRTFGASAPLKELQKKFGFHPENVVAAAREQLGKR